ncbi:MAG: hypothetical protein Q4G10_02355 [Bacteroidia bacterium]|nr:hypothetical protein [Bacteroidia bacterium]
MVVADRLGCKVLVAGAPARSKSDYESYIAGRGNVSLMFGRTYDILKYSEAAIVNSGTASLEAALMDVPQVVCWSTSGLTYFVAKNIIRVGDHIRFISLANLILGRGIFKELIQNDFNPENVVTEVRALMDDASYREKMKSDYAEVRRALGGEGASEAVAEAMVDYLLKFKSTGSGRP